MAQRQNYKEALGKITTFVFDVDGVMTDGRIIVMPNNDYSRSYNVKDGYAIKLATDEGYRALVITGGKEEAIITRMLKLGVNRENIALLAGDKLEKLMEYVDMYKLRPEEMLYMGDDIPDIEAMSYCAIAACPTDASRDVKQIADYVSPLKGGDGCVRDVIEQVLRSQNRWQKFNDAAMGL